MHSSITDPQSLPIHFWKSLWKLNLNDRLKLFLWKIAWNILPTKDRLSQFFPINSDHSCPLCKVETDFMHHLFFNCVFAKVAWRHSFWPLDSAAFSFTSMVDWINIIISPGCSLGIPHVDHHNFQIFASMACDILWFYRNKVLHDGLSFDAHSVSVHINKISLEHFQAWQSKSSIPMEKWTSPPLNWFKINFDIAIRDSFSAQAAVCRDSNGQIIHMISQISLPCLPIVGEALAALLGVSLASQLNIDRFILEGDSGVVVSALQLPQISKDWRISNTI
jgi:hypothetical protein